METLVTGSSLENEREAFLDKLVQSCVSAFEIYGIYIGDRLGYYKALSENGALTSQDLSDQTRTNERYAREWLEHQASVGILRIQDYDRETRQYELPTGHQEVLADENSLNYLAPLARLFVGVCRPVDQLLEVFRNGGGIEYGAYGTDMREGQAAINKQAYLQQLGQEWISEMPDVKSRLESPNGARVADIGCGCGWSSIGIAKTYPNVLVDGYDTDGPSVTSARTYAQEEGVSDRVKFHLHDASDTKLDGQFDLVMACECLHDMSNPVGALKTMRRLAGSNGTVFIVDDSGTDRLEPNAGLNEQMLYGWSIMHCLPAGMAEKPSAGTGTVMRPPTLKKYAMQAGFSSVEELPIENFFFKFFRLNP